MLSASPSQILHHADCLPDKVFLSDTRTELVLLQRAVGYCPPPLFLADAALTALRLCPTGACLAVAVAYAIAVAITVASTIVIGVPACAPAAIVN